MLCFKMQFIFPMNSFNLSANYFEIRPILTSVKYYFAYIRVQTIYFLYLLTSKISFYVRFISIK
jgi:hypothetical protein